MLVISFPWGMRSTLLQSHRPKCVLDISCMLHPSFHPWFCDSSQSHVWYPDSVLFLYFSSIVYLSPLKTPFFLRKIGTGLRHIFFCLMFISNETKNNLQAQKWMPVDCVFAKHNMSFSNKIFAIHIVAKFRPVLAVNTSISRYCVADPGISSRRGWCFITCSAQIIWD